MLYFNRPKSSVFLSSTGKTFTDLTQQEKDNIMTSDKSTLDQLLINEKGSVEVAEEILPEPTIGTPENYDLKGLDINTVNEYLQSQIRQMMVDTNLTERQIYINSLELMRKEVESQKRMLKGLEVLLKTIRSKKTEEEFRDIGTDLYNDWTGNNVSKTEEDKRGLDMVKKWTEIDELIYDYETSNPDDKVIKSWQENILE